jgi:hypothetical protein
MAEKLFFLDISIIKNIFLFATVFKKYFSFSCILV